MERISIWFERLVTGCMLLLGLILMRDTLQQGTGEIFQDIFSGGYVRLLLLLTLVFLTAIVFSLSRLFDRLSPRGLHIAAALLFAVMLICFGVMMAVCYPLPTYDAATVVEKAVDMIGNGMKPVAQDSLYSEYYSYYGNNYFYTVCLMFLYKALGVLGFHALLTPVYILHMIGIMVSAWLGYCTCARLRGESFAVRVLLLCVMNPVYYKLVFWIYTNVASVPFMTAIIYLGVYIWQARDRSGGRVPAAVLGIIAGTGFYIRATCIIPLIAVGICALLAVMRGSGRFRSLLPAACIFIVTLGLAAGGIRLINSHYFSALSEQNFPVTHWLMIASHNDGIFTTDDYHYTASLPPDRRTEEDLKAALQNYSEMTPGELLSFELTKIGIAWAGADSQNQLRMVYDGRAHDALTWISGTRKDPLMLYTYAYRAMLYLLLVLGCIRILLRREHEPMFLPLLAVFGGILFYCLWEVKASYASPFLVLLCMCCACGIPSLQPAPGQRKSAWSSRACKAARILLPAGGAVCGCLLVCLLAELRNTQITERYYAVKGYCNEYNNVTAIDTGAEEARVITQTFRSGRYFDRIDLMAYVPKEATDENCRYRFELTDKDGGIIETADIRPSQFKGRMLRLKLKGTTPDGEEEYTVRIYREEENTCSMRFIRIARHYIDTNPGTLMVNGEVYPSDLYMQVYYRNKEKYLPF